MRSLSIVVCTLGLLSGANAADVLLLEQQLLQESPEVLARAAQKEGDAARGAGVFYQAHLACTKCHTAGEANVLLGPDLASLGKEVTPTYLIEAILRPSKVIKKGFETLLITTTRGTLVAGLLVEEQPDRIVLRDATQGGKPITVATKDIDQRSVSSVSLMPGGLVNQLADRQQFLDLVRYLIAITEKGPARAHQLRPAVIAPPPLPSYEKDLDHAGLIRGFNAQSYERGEVIYQRVCANCHGTKDAPGSLPTSLRFATDKFKNGSDPYRLYRTLTDGFNMMTPQTWMVPQQKYDVIHYIREAYLKEHNPSQYGPVDRAYLEGLPKGKSRGPRPVPVEPWALMNYGPNLTATYEIGKDGSNFAYKGIAIRLDEGAGGVARGRHWMVFDHDTLRLAAAWSGTGFIDWNGINFNGRHEIHPRLVGQVQWANPMGPGWANPETGSFDDPRLRGRDGRPYGPLPRRWARYLGLYHHGDKVILAYTVGDTPVLELPRLNDAALGPVYSRVFNLGARTNELVLQVAQRSKAKIQVRDIDGAAVAILSNGEQPLLARVTPSLKGAAWIDGGGGNLRLRIPSGTEPVRFTVSVAPLEKDAAIETLVAALPKPGPVEDVARLTLGGPARWPDKLTTPGTIGNDDGPFVVDVLSHPGKNPWACQLRFTGLDFLPEGNALAACTWDGDVWRVLGIDHPQRGLTWQRIASGLFQPLGLKIVEGKIHVGCRDQIVILHDRNGDGETDFYECFNNDHQVTEHFHEFAMGLQTDAAGNFYYAKAARHAKTALVPHHGTLLRVRPDGTRTDILATGFRAPNGVCLNPDGSFFLTDQEGHWLPKNRINHVTEGGFYGNLWGYHDVTDASDQAMRQPLCWITNAFDRSPAELLWVNSDAWGPLKGSLMNLSYGYGKVYVVPHEKVNGQVQGGMVALPIAQLPTGIMRGRFHPGDGQLYVCGMFAWAGNQTDPGGLYRIRRTDKPLHVPIGLGARAKGMAITFSNPLDRKTACDPSRWNVKTWALRRSANYGSPHLNEKVARVIAVSLSDDGKTVLLEIEGLQPTWCMEIKYAVQGRAGEAVDGVIHNTVHQVRE